MISRETVGVIKTVQIVIMYWRGGRGVSATDCVFIWQSHEKVIDEA